ncbi:MAG TPA: alkaline phosphatase family protein, partial [bacterium]|nr:alkaline phosphatase family protein [bacterium]
MQQVIVIVVDSLSAQQFEKQLALGHLPNIQRDFVEWGLWVRECVASFPPTSFSSHASIFTGTLPYRHGVASLRWFDRESGHHRSYAGFGAMLLNQDLLNGLGTLHHSFVGEKNTAIGQVVNEGASSAVPPLIPSDGVRMKILRRQFSGKRPPALATIWLTELDPVAHKYGPESPQAERHLQQIDRMIGALMNDLHRRGLDEKTLCVFLADHGQVPCQQFESLPTFLKRTGFDVLDIFYYTLRDEFLFRRYDAVAWGCGVGVYFLYFPHRTGASRHLNWKQRPSLNELHSYPTKGKTVDLVHALLDRESVGLVVVREETQAVRVFGKSGSCRIRWILDEHIPTMTRASFAVEIVEGEDPLDFARWQETAALMDGAFHPASDWFSATVRTEMPDAPVQLVQAMLSERAPDIMVLAAPKWEL